jgi:LysM repeat protein
VTFARTSAPGPGPGTDAGARASDFHARIALAHRPQALRRCACGGSCPRCRASAAHPRLAINTPGDAFEREADRAADAVMSSSPAPFASPSPSRVLRRCACGGSCPACKKQKEEKLHREDAGAGNAPGFAPPVAHQVLASPGRPLDAAARGKMEAGFGADFGGVRVHDGARAAESARAVDAHAYTVGSDIVFASGRYAPGTAAGDRLLAHELAHTLQQEGIARRLQRQHDPDAAAPPAQAYTVQQGDTLWSIARRFGTTPNAIRSLNQLPGDTVRAGQTLRLPAGAAAAPAAAPGPPAAPAPQAAPAADSAAGSPAASPAADLPPLQAGRTITREDRAAITTALGTEAPASTSGAPPVLGTSRLRSFVLHDTAAQIGPGRMAELHRFGEGVMGEAAAAYVTMSGTTEMTHARFFQSRRPTATQFERAGDVLPDPQRDAILRLIWSTALPTVRDAALAGAPAGSGLSPAETRTAVTEARQQLQPGGGQIRTTALRTAQAICSRVPVLHWHGVFGPTASEAAVGAMRGCLDLQRYFGARESRARAATNIEIEQVAGSGCRERPASALVPLPPYSPQRYRQVMLLYLRAALEAGEFPSITTHFWVDRTAGTHCDPRCFNLGTLYGLIAAALGHPAGSQYGLPPSYGTRRGTDTVWWVDAVCGGPHP